ncbi:protein FdrA [Paraburkholderia sp. IMGN_8]|uniref:protein FdrA n=1 Tax=Paraburkholderia sp. IMGN_8 TaxID=3136564 RepID=UPI0031011A49
MALSKATAEPASFAIAVVSPSVSKGTHPMAHLITVHPNSYKDSVRLLQTTRTVLAASGVEWGCALMATPANIVTLAREGFTTGLDKAGINDLVIAVRAAEEESAAAAIATAAETLFGAVAGEVTEEKQVTPDLRAALQENPATNIAVISVPGQYAALEAQKALSAGLHVLLFSDNVPLEDEIALKQRARSLGLLVMGPGAGTAMLGSTGLAFANRVGAGPVGIVAAAGTGAQEVMSLLDRWGVGVSHVIGLGGRDLSPEVGGLMAESALRALDADEATRTILLVSKVPSPEVAEKLLSVPKKPLVASLIGLRKPLAAPANVIVADTLEQGAARTLEVLGVDRPDVAGNLANDLANVVTTLAPSRTRLIGLFSGGTLCYEAMNIAIGHIGPIHSNTPLDDRWTIEAAGAHAHVCLDLGEEQYTNGRPHPMIDAEARSSYLRDQARDPTVAAVLLDVVIGDGAHPDPASVLAPVAAEVVRSGAAVVVYVLGTARDPQGHQAQQEAFQKAGCIVTATAARAALAAAALVLRDPALVLTELRASLAVMAA